MRSLIGLLALVATFSSCFAACHSGLNGHRDWYDCVGLVGLTDLMIPPGVIGINVHNSNISRIPTNAFANFSDSLTHLNLTTCHIEEIEPGAFEGLNKLEELGLVNNSISGLRASWIVSLQSLKTLLVWRNKITIIEPEVYDLLPNLEHLDIAYNQINECLPTKLLKKLKKLRRILIANNPWSYRCRSSMTWYLGSNHIRFIKDWSISDIIVEECLAHELGAQTNDTVLNKCVDRKIGSSDTLPADVGSLVERLRDLSMRVSHLEADVDSLKKHGL